MGIDAISFDLDSEELRARRLEAAYAYAAALPLEPLKPIGPTGLSTVSSIGKAEATDSTASRTRPELEEPKHYMYGLLRAHKDLEAIADKQTRVFETQVKHDLAEIDRLEAEKLEKLRKHSEAVKSEKTWGVLSTVAQYLMAGTAIVLGAAVLAAAPWAGGLMLASGALALGGRVMHDKGTFQAIAACFTKSAELQKKIATGIEMGMLFLSLGFGLGGGAWAHSLGVLSAANNAANIQKVAVGIGLGASLGKGTGDLGIAFTNKRKSHLEADLQITETKRNELYQNMSQYAKDVQKFVDSTGDIGDEIKQAISVSTVHQD